MAILFMSLVLASSSNSIEIFFISISISYFFCKVIVASWKKKEFSSKMNEEQHIRQSTKSIGGSVLP